MMITSLLLVSVAVFDAVTAQAGGNATACPTPCHNGGQVNYSSNFTWSCSCPPGYTGALCDENCNTFCQNGGTLNVSSSGLTCVCANGYSGGLCQTSLCPGVTPSASSAQQKGCPTGFTLLNSTTGSTLGCYKLLTPGNTTCSQGFCACYAANSNAQLAVINSQAKNVAVTSFITPVQSQCAGNIWFGMARQDLNACSGTFYYTPTPTISLPVNYTNWGPTEPDSVCLGGIPQSCVGFYLPYGSNANGYYFASTGPSVASCILCEVPLN